MRLSVGISLFLLSIANDGVHPAPQSPLATSVSVKHCSYASDRFRGEAATHDGSASSHALEHGGVNPPKQLTIQSNAFLGAL